MLKIYDFPLYFLFSLIYLFILYNLNLLPQLSLALLIIQFIGNKAVATAAWSVITGNIQLCFIWLIANESA